MPAALIQSCHPGPTAVVTAVAALVAAGVGLDPAQVILLAAAVLAGQLSVGWSNDAIDAARDRASGRRDKPAATGKLSTPALWRAAGAAVALAVALSVPLGAGAVHLVLPAAGWAYNLGLKGSWWSGAAYAVGFSALPTAPYLMLDGAPTPPWWVPVAGALLGVGAHVANVLPDLQADLATDVRGLPHRIGLRASIGLMATTLWGAVVVTAFGPSGSGGSTAALTSGCAALLTGTAVLVSWQRPESRWTFAFVLALAVLVAAQFALAL